MLAPLNWAVVPEASVTSALRTGAVCSTPSRSEIFWTTSLGIGVIPTTMKSDAENLASSLIDQSRRAVPDTVTRVTRNNPITRALAVVAVRLGLRTRFSAATRPVRLGFNTTRIKRPNKRARSGPPITTPQNNASAPSPRITGWELTKRLNNNADIPAMSRAAPM